MKQIFIKLFAFLVATMYVVVPIAFAEDAVPMLTDTNADVVSDEVADLNDIAVQSDEDDSEVAGITPDSPLYGLDVAMDNIGLMFTFNKVAKAERKLEIANERLKEAKIMAVQNNLEAMEKARVRHDEMLISLENDMDEMGSDNETEDLMDNLRLKAKLKIHQQDVTDVEQELTLRIRGNMSVEQQEKFDAFIESMKGSSNAVEIKIKNREEKIKAVVKQKRNLSDDEIEEEFEKYNEDAMSEHLEDRAETFVDQAEDVIERAENLIEKKEGAGNNVSYAKEQLDSAKTILSEAEVSLEVGEIEDAINLAFKAKRLAIYAASGFSIEKLMNTPLKGDLELDEIQEMIRERKEDMIESRDKIRDKLKIHQDDLENDSESDDEYSDDAEDEVEDDAEDDYSDDVYEYENETSDELESNDDLGDSNVDNVSENSTESDVEVNVTSLTGQSGASSSNLSVAEN